MCVGGLLSPRWKPPASASRIGSPLTGGGLAVCGPVVVTGRVVSCRHRSLHLCSDPRVCWVASREMLASAWRVWTPGLGTVSTTCFDRDSFFFFLLSFWHQTLVPAQRGGLQDTGWGQSRPESQVELSGRPQSPASLRLSLAAWSVTAFLRPSVCVCAPRESCEPHTCTHRRAHTITRECMCTHTQMHVRTHTGPSEVPPWSTSKDS